MGYRGHKTADDLDSPTANPGGMFTKYGAFLDALGYFNSPKNGYSWCAGWICYLFVKVFGADMARKILGQPILGNLGAGAKYICTYLPEVKPRSLADVREGDIICYDFSKTHDEWSHVGFVVGKNSKYVIVAQGNNGSVKGGIVKVVSHTYNYADMDGYVKGYFRPHYEIIGESR